MYCVPFLILLHLKYYSTQKSYIIMQIGTLILNPISLLTTCCITKTSSTTPVFARRYTSSAPACFCNFNDLDFGGFLGKNLQMRNQTAIFSASDGEANLSTDIVKKRKVVEHVSLLKAKEDLSEEQEKDMLDFLYTVQYQMRGIVAISLGRVSGENSENYTHAIYMRFQKKEDLARFYDNPFYLGVLREHVMPYCHEIINVDYESEVEDDILPIFRKGEEFNFGLEFILLIEFSKSALSGPAEDALDAFRELITEFPSLIVQATKGSTINVGTTAYTHASVIRFRSSEAFDIFINSAEYKKIWSSKFQPIIKKALHAPYSVDPVGTELM